MYNLAECLNRRPPKNGRFFMIAIDGRGSSGKTALLEYVRTLYTAFTYLHGDDYFTTFTIALRGASSTSSVLPVISFSRCSSAAIGAQQLRLPDGPVGQAASGPRYQGILSGARAFSQPLDWDLKTWVETPRDRCLARGIERDAHHLPRARVRAAWEKWQKSEDMYLKYLSAP